MTGPPHDNWKSLRSAEEMSSARQWRRALRRVRARGFLGDPLGQGLILIFSSCVTAIAGVWWLLTDHDGMAVLAIQLAAVEIVFLLVMGVKAFKRDKAVQYWHDRKELRMELDREQVFRELMEFSLQQAHRQQLSVSTLKQVEAALGRMTELTYRYLVPQHDDLAVLLVSELDEHLKVLHSSLSHGSRWRDLRSGKRCPLRGDLKERVEELSPNRHFERRIETRTVPIWLVVLHDKSLTRVEIERLGVLPSVFETVANGWGPRVAGEGPRLRVVDSI